jgi:hypothetical protein
LLGGASVARAAGSRNRSRQSRSVDFIVSAVSILMVGGFMQSFFNEQNFEVIARASEQLFPEFVKTYVARAGELAGDGAIKKTEASGLTSLSKEMTEAFSRLFLEAKSLVNGATDYSTFYVALAITGANRRAKQANPSAFPEDFCLQLSEGAVAALVKDYAASGDKRYRDVVLNFVSSDGNLSTELFDARLSPEFPRKDLATSVFSFASRLEDYEFSIDEMLKVAIAAEISGTPALRLSFEHASMKSALQQADRISEHRQESKPSESEAIAKASTAVNAAMQTIRNAVKDGRNKGINLDHLYDVSDQIMAAKKALDFVCSAVPEGSAKKVAVPK